MKKKIVKSFLSTLMCLSLIFDSNIMMAAAQETDIRENISSEEMDIPENIAISEVSSMDPKEKAELTVTKPEDTKEEAIPEEDVTDNERLGDYYKPYDDATYSLKYEESWDDNYKITGFSGVASGNLVIPHEINGTKVTAIGRAAFKECTGFTGNLTIPDSVISIGYSAFKDCRCFTGDLIIPDSVTEIGEYAFGGCTSFTGNLILGNSITFIGYSAFRDCRKLTGNLIIPDSVTEIGESAFCGCTGFTGNLIIPDSVTSIGECAFYGCSGFNGNLTISSTITSIKAETFYGCSGFTGDLVIPDSVTLIGRSAFSGCSGFSGNLLLGNSITSIDFDAFNLCNGFTGDLVIPDNVTSIGESAFWNCDGFDGNLTLGNGITSIGSHAFRDCNGFTGTLTFPDRITNIGDEAFSGCSGFTGSLSIPDSVTFIGYKVFYNCSGFNGRLKIGNNVKWFSNYAFAGCNGFTGSLIFPDGLTDIGPSAFAGCTGFTGSLVFPDGLTDIGSSAFAGCTGFTGTLTIPDSVETICADAFSDCSGFVRMTIGSGVTTIKNNAFAGMNGLLKVVNNSAIAADLPTPEGLTWKDTNGTIVTSIANGTAYRSDAPSYDLIYEILDDGTVMITGYTGTAKGTLFIPDEIENRKVTKIGNEAFKLCYLFKGNLTIPDSVTSIGDSAFYGCTGFTGDLKIPDSVTSIGSEAFYNCRGFDGNLTIPDGVTSIGVGAFYNCMNLTGNLTIPDSVTSIGAGAFWGCSGFTGNLKIPSTVTSIDSHAFDYCSGFTGNLVIPEGVTSIGAHAFWGCSGFTGNLVIPEGVTSIGAYAFLDCSGFTGNLVIPAAVTSIGEDAFSGCSGFTGNLTIPDNVTSIGKYAFSGCSGFNGNLIIPDNTTTIADGVFSGCSGLSGNLVIPAAVTSIGDHAFSGCSGFTGNLAIPDNVTVIKDEVFYNCSGFTGNLIIPAGVTSIGKEAFKYCTGFTGDLTIPDGVTSIGRLAFLGCSGFTGNLTIPDSVTIIDERAFYSCRGFITTTIGSGIATIGANAFAKTTDLRKVVNNSATALELPSPDGQTWVNENGDEVLSIANGTAYRSDFFEPVDAPYFSYIPMDPQTYTGKQIKPQLTVYFGTTELKEKTDYTVGYANNTNAGTATFTIIGIGNYSGTETGTFEIVKKNISDPEVNMSELASAKYNGKDQTPVPKISYNGKNLKKNTDFTVEYYSEEECITKVTPKNPGDYYVKISGTGNFENSRVLPFVITDVIPVGKLTVKKISDQAYSGTQLKPEPVVKMGKKTLIKDTDYTLSWGTNTEIGTGTVSITGMGDYGGTRTETFRITGIPMRKITVNGLKSYEYDGTAKQPVLTLSYKAGKKAPVQYLTVKTQEEYDNITDPNEKRAVDCICTYSKNTDAGKATVTLKGINKCSGTLSKTFMITPFAITNDPDDLFTVSLVGPSYPFAKGGVKPKPVVRFKGTELTEGKDYTLAYANNSTVNDGTGRKKPTVKVIGKSNFKGTDTSATFRIEAADMEATGVKVIVNDVVYKDKAGKWKTKITVAGPDGKALKAGKDYDKNVLYTYEDGTEISPKAIPDAGTVIKVKVNAKGTSYIGSATGQYRIVQQDISKLKATAASKIYTGSAVTLSNDDITWKKGKKAVDNVTFRIDETTYKNNVNASTKKSKASVKVYGTGNYGGNTTVTFKIRGKGVKWWWNQNNL